MRIVKLILLVPFIGALFFFTGSHLAGCNKKTVVDSVYIIRDTTITDSLTDIWTGLVAYYNFNNGSLMDSSGYGNNITFSNANPTSDRYGRPNNAFLFDGATAEMSVPNSPSLNPSAITLYAIFKINGFLGTECHANQILAKGGPDDYIDGWYVLRFDAFPACSLPVDSTKEIPIAGFGNNNSPDGEAAGTGGNNTSYLTKGVWYKVAYTYDGAISKMYINGVLVDSTIKSAPFTPNSYPLSIGYNEDPSWPYWFNGVIDEIRIYNRALGPAAIQALANQTN